MKHTQQIAGALVASALLFGAVLPAMAQTTAGTGSSTRKAANQAALMTKIKARADQELDRRVAALNKLSTRISGMKHVSDSDKAALTGTISGQISTLNDLKTKIDADTDITTMRTDVQSITKSYRIFALVLPEGAIMAAADRVMDIVDTVTNGLVVKLQTRLGEAQTAGNDVSSATTAMNDLTAKLADAKTQAEAAVSEVSVLTPDNGDKTKMESNTAALKDARSKVKAGMADLKAARTDARTIIDALKGMKGHTASTTAAGTAE